MINNTGRFIVAILVCAVFMLVIGGGLNYMDNHYEQTPLSSIVRLQICVGGEEEGYYYDVPLPNGDKIDCVMANTAYIVTRFQNIRQDMYRACNAFLSGYSRVRWIIFTKDGKESKEFPFEKERIEKMLNPEFNIEIEEK